MSDLYWLTDEQMGRLSRDAELIQRLLGGQV